MIRWLIGTSLKFHSLVITIAGVLIFVGVNQLGTMPVDVLPEFSPPFVEIQVEALGLSAEEVEQMITVPLEQDLLAGVAWQDFIRSKSIPGLSSIVIYFEPGTNIYRARQMVAERLAQAAVALPHVSKPPAMIQPTSSASRFMIIGLSSKELSLIEMSVLARWTIGPRLLGVPGVANVALWGDRNQQLQVLVDPEQLQEMGITLEQVVGTTGNALWVTPLTYLEGSTPGTGGFIDTPNQRIGIWHVLPISSPEDLAQVSVERTALTLGDITRIVEDHQPMIGNALTNDESNLLLVVEKLPEASILDVTRDVESALTALRPGFSSIEFDATIFRPATFIEMAMANLTQTLVMVVALLTLVFGLFFYGWRATLISLVSIPVSLMAALYVLYLRGATFNAMVLAGLVVALGLVIDDALVDVEHIMQRLRQNRRESHPEPVERVVMESMVRTRSTIFFVMLIIGLAVMPVFFLEGVTSSLFQPLAVSYLLAMVASMVVAMTVTPVLSVWLLSKANLEKRESPLATWMQNQYERTLARSVQSPGLAYTLIVIFIAAGLAVVPFLRQGQMIPSFREPYVTVRMEAASGTSLSEMNRIVARVSGELRSISGVRNVGAHVGRAVLGDQVVDINSAELWVSIDPAADYDATLAAIQETASGYPGLDGKVQTYIQQTLDQVQTGPSDTYAVRVYGEDHQVLRTEVEKVRQTVAGIEGVVEAQALLPREEPTMEIEVNLAAAQRFGVKPGDVRRAAATLLSGLQVGSLFEEQKIFDVVVWSIPEARQNLSDIRNLLIDTPGGGHVRLGEVAEVRISPAPTVINREAVSPYLDVSFKIRGRNANAALRDVASAIQSHPFPLEYHAELQRDYLTRQKTIEGILIAGALALVGIFLLLQAVSENWSMALASFLLLPATLAGGVLAAFLGDGALSPIPLFGLLAALGMGVRSSILLIKHYEFLEQEGNGFGLAQVIRGSRERLTPLIMSALATSLALLPFILFGNTPGHEVVRPTAIVIMGGLVSSTLLNLFALPALYLRFGARREAGLGLQPVASMSEA